MSFDLQILQEAAPASVIMLREHAIYRDAQRTDRKVQKARNVADLLERGHRARYSQNTALVLDVVA